MTKYEPTLTRHNHPKSRLHLRRLSSCVISCTLHPWIVFSSNWLKTLIFSQNRKFGARHFQRSDQRAPPCHGCAQAAGVCLVFPLLSTFPASLLHSRQEEDEKRERPHQLVQSPFNKGTKTSQSSSESREDLRLGLPGQNQELWLLPPATGRSGNRAVCTATEKKNWGYVTWWRDEWILVCKSSQPHCTDEKTGTPRSRCSGMDVVDTEFETHSCASRPVARIVILFLPAQSALDIEPFWGSRDLTILRNEQGQVCVWFPLPEMACGLLLFVTVRFF